MIAFLLVALFVVVALVTIASLADSAVRFSNSFKALSRERALVQAGFVPQFETQEVRLRQPSTERRGSATRAFAQRRPKGPLQQPSAASA